MFKARISISTPKESIRFKKDKAEAPIAKEDVIHVTCIDRNRDKNGKIISYLIEDRSGFRQIFSPHVLKYKIFTCEMDVDNLTLTTDGRLIEKTVEHKDLNALALPDDVLAGAFAENLHKVLECIVHKMSWEDHYNGYVLRVKLVDNGVNTSCQYKGTKQINYDASNKTFKNCSELILVCRARTLRSKDNVKQVLMDFDFNAEVVEIGKGINATKSLLVKEVLNYISDLSELSIYLEELKSKHANPDINIKEGLNNSRQKSNILIVQQALLVAFSLLYATGISQDSALLILKESSLFTAGCSQILNLFTSLYKMMGPFDALLENNGSAIKNMLPLPLYEANKSIIDEYLARFDRSRVEIEKLIKQLINGATTNTPNKDTPEKKTKNTQNKSGIFGMFKR